MGKLFIGILSRAQLDAIKAAEHAVEDAAISAGQHAVATIKASPIGSTIADMIEAAKDETLTGAQKFTKVLGEALPLIASFIATGGASLVSSLEDTAREVVQSLYNDTIGKLVGSTPSTSPT